MKLHRFLTIFTIALVIILVAVVWFFPPNGDFRAGNPFWNGIKDVSSVIPALPLESLSDLPIPPDGSTLIIIPYSEFTLAEIGELDRFVTQGGSLVLADDYGYGNQILEYLGLEARFSGQALLDPLFNYKNKWFPRISDLAPSSITNNIKSLILNHATCLVDVESNDALALSSSMSFLDLDGNQVWDEGEPTGPLPVLSCHSFGSGQIILIADPSLFINSMEKIEGNHDLVQNIAATSRLFIDQSHLPPSNLHRSKDLLASLRSYLVTPVGAVGLVILVLAITLIPIWYRIKREDFSGRESVQLD